MSCQSSTLSCLTLWASLNPSYTYMYMCSTCTVYYLLCLRRGGDSLPIYVVSLTIRTHVQNVQSHVPCIINNTYIHVLHLLYSYHRLGFLLLAICVFSIVLFLHYSYMYMWVFFKVIFLLHVYFCYCRQQFCTLLFSISSIPARVCCCMDLLELRRHCW